MRYRKNIKIKIYKLKWDKSIKCLDDFKNTNISLGDLLKKVMHEHGLFNIYAIF